MAHQLLLPINRHEDKTFDNYHAADNEIAVASLREMASTDGGFSDNRQLYICGASMTGKSHLLQAVCRTAEEHGHRSAYLPLAEAAGYEPLEVFEGLDDFAVLCVDDMDAVLPDESWQRGLFALINLRRHLKGMLVMAGQTNPLHLSLPFKDLSSRLKLSVVYRLEIPPDDDKALILRDIARRSGTVLSAEVVAYMLNHHSRDFSYLVKLVELSSLTAQREKRQMTIPFIKHIAAGLPA